jgi:peptide-methionine (R)-S-oxide reductase
MLTKEQYEVTQEEGTERPFTNAYAENKEKGIYVDIVSGEPLFLSVDKYDSGTGWPSFDESIPGTIEYNDDTSHGMARTEVRCATCHAHLGHVFPDGLTGTGKRYCINSICLGFEEEKDKK